jgi:autotransporter-associated beta strand protein
MTDIVVPQGATSYATPTVSSAAALLLQVAGGNSAANNPTTIKAILMAGTDKNAVSSWVRTYTQPLDLQYGAGQLNIQRAYTILAAGQQAASTSSLVNSTGWDSNSLASQGSSNYYYFTVPADQSYDLSAILAWNRPIAASDLVFRSAAPSLADLSLTLYQASGFSTGAMVDQSTSMIDNVQDIFQRVLPAGQYALQVTREDSFDNLLVPGSYALAWQLQASTMIPVWNGGGATGGTSNKWSMGANWAGGPNGYSGTPTAPQVLTFGPLASGGFTTCNNDFAGGTRFGGLTFNSGAAAYTLQGAAIALTGPVINQSTNNQTINLNLQLGAGGGTFDTGSGGLTVNGLISGSGIGLTKRGAGVLALSGVNNYDGGTTVMDGLLVAMGGDALPPGRALDIEGGGVVLDNATMPAGELGYGGAGGGPVAAPAATMAAMPEPGTLGLLAAGLAGLAVLAWRKGRRAARRS